MKVIKPGNGAKGWSKNCVCTGKGNGDGGCGAVLQVERDDLFFTYNSCRDETDTFITFKCTLCEVLTDIDAPFHGQELPTRTAWEKSHPKVVTDSERGDR